MMMTKQLTQTENCIAALMPLAAGRLTDFQGLAYDCALETLKGQWPAVDEWQGAGYLGSRQRARQFQYLALGGLSKAARVWFDGAFVQMIDIANPALAWADILALGEPAARLETSRTGTPIPDGEWVYPQRGLSLHIRPAANQCFHLIAFPPVILAEFMAEYRLTFSLIFRPDKLEEK